MKNINILYSIVLIISLSIVTSCDSGFDAMNTSDVAINELDPVPLLNHAIWRSSPGAVGRATMLYEKAIVQHMLTPFAGGLEGGNYNVENRGHAAQTWNNHYQHINRNTLDIIERTKDDPARSNINSMAKIWRVYGGMMVTDLYGDVPYSEAGVGFIDNVERPVYDEQSEIYPIMLEELREATAALSSNSTIESSEILYSGSIEKWQRFGYSLMLRAAMRLTKVDPDLSREYVEIAYEGGVMESNDDNAIVRHSSIFQNNIGSQLNSSEAANFYMTKPLVDFFQSNNDPRLDVMAVRYVGATGGGSQTESVATRDPEEQIGIPMGYNNLTIEPIAENDGVGTFYAYSQFDRNTIGKNTAPYFLLTHAQTQFLLAEAAERGWVTGTSSDYFAEGIRAHMNQLETHDSNLFIEENTIGEYVEEQVELFNSGNQLEHINTQYWVASLFNAQEAWANFRRSGYPDLEPNPYPGSAIPSGSFIRRLVYPSSELNNNLENVNQAISRQGPDQLDTRVWWDVE